MFYQERNEEQRKAFIAQLAKFTPEQLVFVDECGLDEGL
jgi:hypothetical protein